MSKTMADNLLIFPPDVPEAADYDEVLRAIARLVKLNCHVSSRRSPGGWTISLEAHGRLARARHADDGTVALEAVVPLFNRALDDGRGRARLYGYVEADWGAECGVIRATSRQLPRWVKRGEVTAYETPDTGAVATGSRKELDRLVTDSGPRMDVRDGPPSPALEGSSDLDRLVD